MAVTAAGIRAKPASGWPLRQWVFMRVSGALLVVLALGHLWIMHVIHTVEEINYNFVVERLGTSLSFWRWYDLLLLGLAMLHGINGLHVLIDDYIHAPRWHRLSCIALDIVGTVLLMLGGFVLLTFQPSLAR